MVAKENQRQGYVSAISDAMITINVIEGKMAKEEGNLKELEKDFDKRSREKTEVLVLTKKIDICQRALQTLSEKNRKLWILFESRLNLRLMTFFLI